jgi:hypothetical protein
MPIKPKFPRASSADLAGRLDKIRDTVNQAKTTDANGVEKVDVERLDQLAEASGDKTIRDGVEAIKDEFSTYETVTVTGGCGPTTRQRQIEPTELDAGQVQNVFSALIDAKSKVDDHIGADGKLSRDEAERTHNISDDLSGKLAEAAMKGVLSEFKVELSDWVELVSDTAYEVDARGVVDEYIGTLAEYHSDSLEGAEALRWAMRADVLDPDLEMTRGGKPDRTYMLREHFKEMASSAERSIWHRLFGDPDDLDRGHLSDDEICRHYGADSLAELTASMKAKVEGRVGDYMAYVEGSDLPHAEHAQDPDVRSAAVSSNC